MRLWSPRGTMRSVLGSERGSGQQVSNARDSGPRRRRPRPTGRGLRGAVESSRPSGGRFSSRAHRSFAERERGLVTAFLEACPRRIVADSHINPASRALFEGCLNQPVFAAVEADDGGAAAGFQAEGQHCARQFLKARQFSIDERCALAKRGPSAGLFAATAASAARGNG